MAQKQEDLLQKPLYVFDLPKDILHTLTQRSSNIDFENQASQTQHEVPGRNVDESEKQEKAKAGSTSCGLCGLSFSDFAEQRSHVRSDFHGYNLKQKLKGLKPVTEDEFEKLIAELDESISGSDSTDSEASADGDDGIIGPKPKDSTLTALLKKQARIAEPDENVASQQKRQRGSGTAPLLWFTSSALPEEVSLGMYRAIFTNIEQEEAVDLADIIRGKQLSSTVARPKKEGQASGDPQQTTSSPHYFLCMIGGGHFAAMIVSLTPKMGKRHNGGDERQATVLAHKTFHRYTTRRKQGGSQSTNDNSKGNAHSAGSSLRRYNEVALTNEVRELLSQWKGMIGSSELLFIRATGTTNRRTLYGPYEEQVLRHNDPRIRGFPFSTRRATQGELMRSFVELTRVKVSRISEESLSLKSTESKELPLRVPKKAPAAPPQPSKEESETELHTNQIVALINRSKVPALLNYLSTNAIDLSNFRFYPYNHHTPTPLHLAASLNASHVVLALLVKAGASPMYTDVDEEARQPYALAGNRATRDAFRQARSELGETAWNWDAAGVPVALSKDDIAQRASREKAEREAEEKQEAERRKTEAERLRKETEREERERREKKTGKGRALGGRDTVRPAQPMRTAEERREEDARGMTPEMRARLERERRARAAEERIRRMAGGQ